MEASTAEPNPARPHPSGRKQDQHPEDPAQGGGGELAQQTAAHPAPRQTAEEVGQSLRKIHRPGKQIAPGTENGEGQDHRNGSGMGPGGFQAAVFQQRHRNHAAARTEQPVEQSGGAAAQPAQCLL